MGIIRLGMAKAILKMSQVAAVSKIQFPTLGKIL
jgi:hypothetical protein